MRTGRHTSVLLGVLGLIAAVVLWGLAGWELCGMSGCGGGGFGRNYGPRSVQLWLALSGVFAAARPAVIARRSGSRRLLCLAAVLLLLVPVMGGMVIGARLDGYPHSVPNETLEREIQEQRDR